MADRRDSYRDDRPAPNPWTSPPTLIATATAVAALVGSWLTLSERLTTVEAQQVGQAAQLLQLASQLSTFSGFDASLARMEERIDGQGQLLRSIESVLLQKDPPTGQRPRQ